MLLWEVLKYSLGLVFALVCFVVYRHSQAMKKVKFYADQGMSPLPGYDKFLIGNVVQVRQWMRLREENKGKRPLKIVTGWINDQLDPNGGENSYNASTDPVLVVNFGSNIHLFVADPDMIQDLFVTRNQIFDKTGTLQGSFSKLIGESFLFSQADEAWKAKRKVCAHAFYKERLGHMIEVLKDKLANQCEAWAQEIRASPSKQTEINITKVFQEIFARNIIHIAFGEDVSDQTATIWTKTDLDGKAPMVEKELPIYQAIENVGEQLISCLKMRVSNPVYKAIWATAKVSVSFSTFERKVDENCGRMRAFVHGYINERIQGLRKSKVGADADLLSLFMQSPDIFTNDFIVDELWDFFIAATVTTMNTMQNIVSHFATCKESHEKVRAEFKQETAVDTDENTTDKLTKKSTLAKNVTYETCQELVYLQQVIYEALRFQPPVPHSTVQTLSQDARIGKYNIKAGDIIQINIHGVHRHPDQWQRPNEFLPERFNPEDPLSLTPKGEKRSNFAFVPFLGGKRVCFGKTFAEVNLKVTATYLSEYFDMEFVDKEKYPDTHSLPMAQTGQSERLPIMVRFKERE